MLSHWFHDLGPSHGWSLQHLRSCGLSVRRRQCERPVVQASRGCCRRREPLHLRQNFCLVRSFRGLLFDQAAYLRLQVVFLADGLLAVREQDAFEVRHVERSEARRRVQLQACRRVLPWPPYGRPSPSRSVPALICRPSEPGVGISSSGFCFSLGPARKRMSAMCASYWPVSLRLLIALLSVTWQQPVARAAARAETPSRTRYSRAWS